MILRRPLRSVCPEHIEITNEGEKAVLPTTPIDYEVTPRGKGEYLPTQGKFRKGNEPRRHTFTREECQKGYQSAVQSLLRRFPGCDPHFLMCAITGAQPWHKLPDVQYLLNRNEPLTDAELHHQFARA